MKMVKSLLLGSAAGVVAVTTGQAADLPVKAKPVEYVKVCSLYGAGFFYIPGTDKCIKLGGYFREQWDIHGAGDAFSYMNSESRWTRSDTSDSSFRARTNFTIDVREQSAYGTIRGYTSFGANQTTGSDSYQSSLYFTRSFVQFAGFTGGRAVSFFDFISFDPYGLANIRPNLGNTGATGIDVFAYTWQLGNGASFTVSAEDACADFGISGATAAASSDRGCETVNASIPGSTGVGAATYDNGGYNQPDVVAVARVDQAWGSAQLMGAIHRVSAGYYSTAAAYNQNNGHPGDEEGWAIGAGFILNNVLGMPGDQFGLQANYTHGAVGYLSDGTGATEGFAAGANGFGNSVTWGHMVDGIFSSTAACGVGGVTGTASCGTGIELTTGWTIGGMYEHHWSPQWKTSIYGGYIKITYDNTAAAYYCTGSPTTYVRGSTPGTTGGSLGVTMGAGSSCDPNMALWSLGTRTMWNPNSNLDLGVDFMWNSLDTASTGVASLAAQGARPASTGAAPNSTWYNINGAYNVYTVAIRAQYNFLP